MQQVLKSPQPTRGCDVVVQTWVWVTWHMNGYIFTCLVSPHSSYIYPVQVKSLWIVLAGGSI